WQSGEPTTSTNANGNYVISNLNAGKYTVRQLLPAGWTQTYPLANAGHDIEIAKDVYAMGRSFGTQGPPPPIPAGTIKGSVYNDLNGNGVRDSGEPGLSGRKAWLDKDKDGVVDST